MARRGALTRRHAAYVPRDTCNPAKAYAAQCALLLPCCEELKGNSSSGRPGCCRVPMRPFLSVKGQCVEFTVCIVQVISGTYSGVHE